MQSTQTEPKPSGSFNNEFLYNKLQEAEFRNLGFLHKMRQPGALSSIPEQSRDKMRQIIERSQEFHALALNLQVHIQRNGADSSMGRLIQKMEAFCNVVGEFA